MGCTAVCFGWLWPVRTNVDGAAMHLLNYAAFAIRTLPLHGVIACILLLKIALFLRMRRVLLPLLAITGFLAWPVWLDVRPKSPPTPTGETITVYSANLLFGRADPDILTGDIQRADADLILFQEFTPSIAQALRHRLKRDYPHSVEAPAENASGKAIFSRFPFRVEPILPGDVVSDSMRIRFEFDGRGVAAQNIHFMTPLRPGLIEIQSNNAADIVHWIRSESLPVLIAGDFNCTPASAHAGWLRGAGFIDAHRAVGEGIGATWSMNGFRRFITQVRIDHVYTANGLVPISQRLGSPNGSDHRPLITTVGFLSRPQRMP